MNNTRTFEGVFYKLNDNFIRKLINNKAQLFSRESWGGLCGGIGEKSFGAGTMQKVAHNLQLCKDFSRILCSQILRSGL